MFKQFSGKTLTKDQLIDWSINKGISQITVEDMIYKALDAKAKITQLSKKYMEGMNEKMKGKDKPTRKLMGTSLKGQNHTYTVYEPDMAVIIIDLQTKSEIEVPFDEFPAFAAELSNFNANYLKRWLQQ